MRGVQLGAALGATVWPNISDSSGFDIAIVVKRTPESIIRGLKIPWFWDIVDAYPQPESYRWDRSDAIHWVHERIHTLKPTGMIWPTKKMMDDCDLGLPGVVIPHHHRLGILQNPIRQTIQTIGYEGAPSYLGRWRNDIEQECKKRGWSFVVNPTSLSEIDIVLAMRDNGGYVSKNWKSGVKLANAHASGTPFIGQPECGYLENASGAEYWAESMEDVRMAFDWLDSYDARKSVSEKFRQNAYSVNQAASDLKRFLCAL